MKVEFEVEEDGTVNAYGKTVKHKKRFPDNEQRVIGQFVRAYRSGIVLKWDLFFNKKKKPRFEKINKQI